MQTRPCPNCGMDIPQDAITCKHCGALMLTSDNPMSDNYTSVVPIYPKRHYGNEPSDKSRKPEPAPPPQMNNAFSDSVSEGF